MLTISQLAAYADVTVRTIRHYHHVGLLPEPERDRSGYRRYDATAVAVLIRVRTLAAAGVPLSRVQALLHADEEEFAAAVAEVDQRLRSEIAERQRHRRRIAQLAAGDNLALPPEAASYLRRLRSLGLPQTMIDAERDAWILVAAELPQHMSLYMQLKEQQLDDPAVMALYRDLAEAIGWSVDDPRVEALADRLVGLLEAADQASDDTDLAPDQEFGAISDDLAALLDSVFLEAVPVARRLLAALERRGWTGWTNTRRIPER